MRSVTQSLFVIVATLVFPRHRQLKIGSNHNELIPTQSCYLTALILKKYLLNVITQKNQNNTGDLMVSHRITLVFAPHFLRWSKTRLERDGEYDDEQQRFVNCRWFGFRSGLQKRLKTYLSFSIKVSCSIKVYGFWI